MEVAADASAARWMTGGNRPRLGSANRTLVSSVVPEGFESYAAVRHEGGDDFDLSARDTSVLVGILREHTSSPDECWFCLWTGYGEVDTRGFEQAIVSLFGREYVLLKGPLEAVCEFAWVRPKIWWPSDRLWCVGGDIDFVRSFVGGDASTVEGLVGSEELDVQRVDLDCRIDETNDVPRLGQPPSGREWR